MNTLFQNVKHLLQEKAPKKYKREIAKLADPTKLIIYLDHSRDSTIGNYVLEKDLIVLNSYCSYCSNYPKNSFTELPTSFTFQEFKRLIESNILQLNGVRGIYSLTKGNKKGKMQK